MQMNRDIPKYEDTLSEEEFVTQQAPSMQQAQQPAMPAQQPMPSSPMQQAPAMPAQQPMAPQPQTPFPQNFNPFPTSQPIKQVAQPTKPDLGSLLGDYDSLVKPTRKPSREEVTASNLMKKASQVEDNSLKNDLITLAKQPEAIRIREYEKLLKQRSPELDQAQEKKVPSTIPYGSTIDKQKQQKQAEPKKLIGKEKALSIAKDLVSKGFTPEQAAAIAGNAQHETNQFKNLQEIEPLIEGSKGGYGYLQWTGPRRRNYEKWAKENKLDPSSDEANMGYLANEINDPSVWSKGGKLKFQNSSTVDEATEVFEKENLRPAPNPKHSDLRKKYANEIYKELVKDLDKVKTKVDLM